MYFGPSGLAQSIPPFLKKNEQTIFLLLFFFALVRIFLFCASFPLFNNIDELAHFDTVVKYSRGYTPGKDNDYYDTESANLIARYATFEYVTNQTDHIYSPLTTTSKEINETANSFHYAINHEALSPPLYYLIAGCWFNLGKLIHLQGGYLLYWLRFLNLPIYALLLWMSYRFCKFSYPESPFLRLGMTLLLAFFPQDVFYSINNDVLSPLFFLCGSFLLLQLLRADCSLWIYFLSGCIVAATILVKLSNLPALLVYCIILLWIIKLHITCKSITQRIPHILLLCCATIAPLALWASRNVTIQHFALSHS